MAPWVRAREEGSVMKALHKGLHMAAAYGALMFLGAIVIGAI
jgi:hypothetical protein